MGNQCSTWNPTASGQYTMWRTAGGDTTPWISFDLGQSYSLTGLNVLQLQRRYV